MIMTSLPTPQALSEAQMAPSHITMPPAVLDWVRQFSGETIYIHVTSEGFVSLWDSKPNINQELQASDKRLIRATTLLEVLNAMKDPEGEVLKSIDGMNSSVRAVQACASMVSSLMPAQDKEKGK